MDFSIVFANIFSERFLGMAIRLAAPLLFAGMGAFIASSAGIANISIESIMTMSALFGVLGSYWTQNAVLGLLIGLAMGVLMACLVALFSMKLGASPILVGVALNTFSNSLAIFILYLVTGSKGSSATLLTPGFGSWDIPIIKDIPILGTLLSGHYVLTYVSWIAAVVLFILVFKTPLGMRMRACGLNADAAKSAGINVDGLRLLALILSGLFAAFGGVFLSLNNVQLFSSGMVSGQGWMGIAANGIAQGNFGALVLSSFVFAIFRAVAVIFVGTEFPSELIGAIPYIAVFVGLCVISIVNTYRIKKGNIAGK